MSVFGSGDVLGEEIVETTEEQEQDLCSAGETVDECSVIASMSINELLEHQEQQKQQQINNRQNGTNHTGKSRSNSTNSNNSSSNNSNVSNGRVTSRSHMEQEKRMRREIANSNERRRMQSINAGFQSLKTLLPHHEGEKLSKAAILQQTAEYIYQLEQQKTQLLSQNLQLKRLVEQQEGGDEVPATKKRRGETQGGVVVSLPVHVNESGDEGLGSMSPEPLSVITVSADGHSSTSLSLENAELKRQLERERLARVHLEKQVRSMQNQFFPERFREGQLIAYQPHEVIEHTNNVTIGPDLDEAMQGVQLVSVVSVPTVGSTQTIETSNADSNTPPLSPQAADFLIPDDDVILKEELIENSPASSPKLLSFTNVRVFDTIEDAQASAGSFSPNGVNFTASSSGVVGSSCSSSNGATLLATGNSSGSAQFIGVTPPREFSPEPETPRLPSVLEAAMKAEPKVEVERLPSPSNSMDECTQNARLYLANTSRQNLETIVEAIRHLEGDHLFSDEPAQDVPLALTTGGTVKNTNAVNKQRLQAEVNNFLQFHSQQQAQAQHRPGVIVVKHS